MNSMIILIAKLAYFKAYEIIRRKNLRVIVVRPFVKSFRFLNEAYKKIQAEFRFMCPLRG